eukprot:768130-Hanusia_phi.AAC.7
MAYRKKGQNVRPSDPTQKNLLVIKPISTQQLARFEFARKKWLRTIFAELPRTFDCIVCARIVPESLSSSARRDQFRPITHPSCSAC